MIFVPLDHPLQTIHIGCLPLRIVAQEVGLLRIHQSMALEIGLVDHVETVCVAQVEKVRVRRVVTGADGVDVMTLHQEDVFEHGLVWYGTT